MRIMLIVTINRVLLNIEDTEPGDTYEKEG